AGAGQLPPLPGVRRVRRQRRDGAAAGLGLHPHEEGDAAGRGAHAARRRRLRRVCRARGPRRLALTRPPKAWPPTKGERANRRGTAYPGRMSEVQIVHVPDQDRWEAVEGEGEGKRSVGFLSY